MVLLDDELNVLYHPEEDAKTIDDFEEESQVFKDELISKNKETGIIEYEANREKKLFIYKRLSNGWILGASPVLSEMFKTLNLLKNTIIIITIVVLIIGAISSQIVGNSISKPVKAMAEKFGDLAQGDLNVDIDIKSKDEIGTMAQEFTMFTSKLKGTITGIKSLADEVQSSNEELTKAIDNIINGENSKYANEIRDVLDKGMNQLNEQVELVLDNVRNQTASSEESLAALEEISATSDHIGENIKKTEDSFQNTLEIARNSSEDMNNMAISMSDINKSVSKTNTEIDNLKGVSNVIDSCYHCANVI